MTQYPASADDLTVPPSALAEPTVPPRRGWTAAVVLVNLGINAAFFGPIQVLLGTQAAAFDEAGKEAILALVTGCGAAVSLVANPLFGAFSDRTTSRLGRRIPWVFIGAVLGSIALLGLTVAPSVAIMTLLWCLVQLGCNGALAAITAAIPDRVPVPQRGVVGGVVSMGTVLGILVGAGIGAVAGKNFALGYLICAVALLLGIGSYILRREDTQLTKAEQVPFSWGGFFGGFWISPRKYPDFGWAWLTRFLVQLGNHICTLYLLFFLSDEVHYENPAFGVLVLTGIYAVLTIVTAAIGGIWTDKVGRRKPFVIASSVIIAIASLVLAFAPSWTGAITGAAILGIGYGAYLAVDLALLTQVLPAAVSRGKDLGVINVANSLPQVLAPLIAFPFVAYLGGYLTLYVVAGVIGLLGAVFVVKIKSVR
ncbi:MFS family permease [Psychromicrobium silvestre]|uniref:MFS family permease n=1 Tax=Psychromicrobium silvestre TaxID=1645614 RepID=A0A7Y9LUB6_9MICC|nr:MFS transporter [Psychromicrobium silvestre]NYE95758.1 MFS family permease [Psychromicrobium silvestre]